MMDGVAARRREENPTDAVRWTPDAVVRCIDVIERRRLVRSIDRLARAVDGESPGPIECVGMALMDIARAIGRRERER